jgi:hypothetical protein
VSARVESSDPAVPLLPDNGLDTIPFAMPAEFAYHLGSHFDLFAQLLDFDPLG